MDTETFRAASFARAKRALFPVALHLALVLPAAACAATSDPPPLSVTDYDQSCTSDKECVAVDVEPRGCGCGSDAIDVQDRDRFRTDFTARRDQCHHGLPACDCAPPHVACESGRCKLVIERP